jgi:hypothetical protein
MEEVEEAPVSLRGLRRRATWVAAHRVDLSVYYRRLEREEYRTLKAIGEDRTLAEALVAGFEESTMEAVRRAVRVKEWFRTWAELGWVCAPDLESLVKG